MGDDLAGFAAEIALATSVIEVAGDGRTAKAAWMAPGFETTRDTTGGLHACWVWHKYACDFRREQGQWKLRHLKNFLVFAADYYQSWVEEGGEHWSRRPGGLPPFGGAAPSPYRHLPYTQEARPTMLPALPKPYETYDGSMDWVEE
jgi:hypothetical protein